MNRLECDVLILGSGAAGGVLAGTLSEHSDLRIVLAEKGPHYTRSFFNQRELDMNALYADDGARSTADGAMPVRGGECVGGGTTVNIALCFDPIPSLWERWRSDYGLSGFSFGDAADYGVAGLDMSSCLREVRERSDVHTPPRSAINDNNRVLEDGCRALGIPSRRFELNMRGCIGCGFCAQGCAYDAKRGSMLTYIADATARGVRLVHHFSADQLTLRRTSSGVRATGATGTVRPTADGSQPNSVAPGPLRIDARLVIVACGAIETPRLLLASDHPDPHDVIGRGLVLHPSLPIVALLDRDLINYRGITGTIYSDHFRDSHGFYYECLFGHPVYGSMVMPGIGPEHFELMLQYRRVAGFGAMLIDTVNPENRVTRDPRTGRARIDYRLGHADRERLREAARIGVEIAFAGGAREVLLPSEEAIGPLPRPHFRRAAEAVHCRDLSFAPHATVITSAHAQATVKMGADPRRSVVDSRGECHFAENLIVCDSSVFPESCGANPMISIMTMARYQGKRIAAERDRYGL